MNQIIIHGRLTDNVKQSKSFKGQNDQERAAFRFSIASNRVRQKEKTDFIDCVWFLPVSNRITTYLTKGKGVVITGELQVSSFKDKDGNSRRKAEVNVGDLEFASGSSAKAGSNSSTADQANSSADQAPNADDDDLPF